MPTSHPRIGVVRDAELDAAIRLTAPLLGRAKGAATLVRELALRGARAVAEEAEADLDPLVRRLVEEHGARPGRGRLVDALEELGPVDPSDPTPGSDALQALRDEGRG